ncbi:Inactive protein RESTRICTED TEV MOVEMENT 2 [Nymphaea thermarum]|nr:Inactive protein RESTRICTED TEV MOVEMENT 2 [Nymphaea thermarum]
MASSSSNAPAKTSSKVFDYQPKSRWYEDEESKVLQIELPDFKRDELRVQTDGSGRLRVSGQRRIDSKKSSRFEESFPIPDGVDHTAIKAKFDSGILHVIMPFKKMPPLVAEEGSPATGEAPTESGDGKPGRRWRDRLDFCLGTRRKRIVSACVGLATLATVLGLYVAYRQGYSAEDWNRWKREIGETFALEKFPVFPRF